MFKKMSFKDKVVVVSGSSQGIGKAIAREFLSYGAYVVINGRNEAKLKKLCSMSRGKNPEHRR